jgi:hydroxymethylpyrimidine pyrophosphatase-like HAD family hydrolase
VYSQGLMVFGVGGELIHEEFLPSSVIALVEHFCTTQQIALICYAGDTIYAAKQCAYTRKIAEYKEPLPELFEAGLGFLEASGVRANKVILLADEAQLTAIRPTLAALLGSSAALTKAVPGMLEVLPYGASKGSGVRRLLSHYEVLGKHTMAFGDGEVRIRSTYIYTYTHIHIVCLHTYIHIHTHTYTYIHTYIHTHTYTYTHTYIHTHTCTSAYRTTWR